MTTFLANLGAGAQTFGDIALNTTVEFVSKNPIITVGLGIIATAAVTYYFVSLSNRQNLQLIEKINNAAIPLAVFLSKAAEALNKQLASNSEQSTTSALTSRLEEEINILEGYNTQLLQYKSNLGSRHKKSIDQLIAAIKTKEEKIQTLIVHSELVAQIETTQKHLCATCDKADKIARIFEKNSEQKQPGNISNHGHSRKKQTPKKANPSLIKITTGSSPQKQQKTSSSLILPAPSTHPRLMEIKANRTVLNEHITKLEDLLKQLISLENHEENLNSKLTALQREVKIQISAAHLTELELRVSTTLCKLTLFTDTNQQEILLINQEARTNLIASINALFAKRGLSDKQIDKTALSNLQNEIKEIIQQAEAALKTAKGLINDNSHISHENANVSISLNTISALLTTTPAKTPQKKQHQSLDEQRQALKAEIKDYQKQLEANRADSNLLSLVVQKQKDASELAAKIKTALEIEKSLSKTNNIILDLLRPMQAERAFDRDLSDFLLSVTLEAESIFTPHALTTDITETAVKKLNFDSIGLPSTPTPLALNEKFSSAPPPPPAKGLLPPPPAPGKAPPPLPGSSSQAVPLQTLKLDLMSIKNEAYQANRNDLKNKIQLLLEAMRSIKVLHEDLLANLAVDEIQKEQLEVTVKMTKTEINRLISELKKIEKTELAQLEQQAREKKVAEDAIKASTKIEQERIATLKESQNPLRTEVLAIVSAVKKAISTLKVNPKSNSKLDNTDKDNTLLSISMRASEAINRFAQAQEVYLDAHVQLEIAREEHLTAENTVNLLDKTLAKLSSEKVVLEGTKMHYEHVGKTPIAEERIQQTKKESEQTQLAIADKEQALIKAKTEYDEKKLALLLVQKKLTHHHLNPLTTYLGTATGQPGMKGPASLLGLQVLLKTAHTHSRPPLNISKYSLAKEAIVKALPTYQKDLEDINEQLKSFSELNLPKDAIKLQTAIHNQLERARKKAKEDINGVTGNTITEFITKLVEETAKLDQTFKKLLETLEESTFSLEDAKDIEDEKTLKQDLIILQEELLQLEIQKNSLQDENKALQETEQEQHATIAEYEEFNKSITAAHRYLKAHPLLPEQTTEMALRAIEEEVRAKQSSINYTVQRKEKALVTLQEKASVVKKTEAVVQTNLLALKLSLPNKTTYIETDEAISAKKDLLRNEYRASIMAYSKQKKQLLFLETIQQTVATFDETGVYLEKDHPLHEARITPDKHLTLIKEIALILAGSQNVKTIYEDQGVEFPQELKKVLSEHLKNSLTASPADRDLTDAFIECINKPYSIKTYLKAKAALMVFEFFEDETSLDDEQRDAFITATQEEVVEKITAARMPQKGHLSLAPQNTTRQQSAQAASGDLQASLQEAFAKRSKKRAQENQED